MQGFIIAGTNSGCGKTTVSIGLMALLKSLGHAVAPFKTGPDYIDPLFHEKIVQTPSYNLDSFLLSDSAINYLFQKHTRNKSIAIVEGVMGMYDGLGQHSQGSAHELSNILGLPVVLVVNCKGLYQSVAAIVKGFSTMKPDARVKGVILNHCSSDDHYQFLKEIIEKECGLACIGYVPYNKDIVLESRHLGLIQAEEVDDLNDKVNQLCQTLSSTIDVQALLDLAELPLRDEVDFPQPQLDLSELHIGVASDKAFRFYYQDNMELLQELGATLHYFSPLKDDAIPTECNCLYLGGGYPEVFAADLVANVTIRKQIKQKIKDGMPVYAECGGLMYLTQKIIDLDGKDYPMAGVFNSSVQMTKRLQRFGYAELDYAGIRTRCHEFHHSKLIEYNTPNYQKAYHLNKPDKNLEWSCGLHYKNCLAGYAHLHFYSDLRFFENIVGLWKKVII